MCTLIFFLCDTDSVYIVYNKLPVKQQDQLVHLWNLVPLSTDRALWILSIKQSQLHPMFLVKVVPPLAFPVWISGWLQQHTLTQPTLLVLHSPYFEFPQSTNCVDSPMLVKAVTFCTWRSECTASVLFTCGSWETAPEQGAGACVQECQIWFS